MGKKNFVYWDIMNEWGVFINRDLGVLKLFDKIKVLILVSIFFNIINNK